MEAERKTEAQDKPPQSAPPAVAPSVERSFATESGAKPHEGTMTDTTRMPVQATGQPSSETATTTLDPHTEEPAQPTQTKATTGAPHTQVAPDVTQVSEKSQDRREAGDAARLDHTHEPGRGAEVPSHVHASVTFSDLVKPTVPPTSSTKNETAETNRTEAPGENGHQRNATAGGFVGVLIAFRGFHDKLVQSFLLCLHPVKNIVRSLCVPLGMAEVSLTQCVLDISVQCVLDISDVHCVLDKSLNFSNAYLSTCAWSVSRATGVMTVSSRNGRRLKTLP